MTPDQIEAERVKFEADDRFAIRITHFCLSGQFRDPKDCPKDNSGKCCKCGSDDLTAEYGFGGGYGLGIFTRCMSCFAVMNFMKDES